jgi:hypothetical protein
MVRVAIAAVQPVPAFEVNLSEMIPVALAAGV